VQNIFKVYRKDVDESIQSNNVQYFDHDHQPCLMIDVKVNCLYFCLCNDQL
jgi:hypothetical protein